MARHQTKAMRSFHPSSSKGSLKVSDYWLSVILAVAVFSEILGFSGRPAFAWGPAAHRLVANWAVQTLPPGVRDFFEANRQMILDHSNDPLEWIKKDRYERMRHYIYLDHYGLFPYPKLPHGYKGAVGLYGKGRVGRDGVLPWQVGEYSLKLTVDLRTENWEGAKLDAAALAFYVADAHDPLHTTSNYDGQLTGQTGLEGRFGDRLVERSSSFFMVHPGTATQISDPTEHAFEAALEANSWVDRILLADIRARRDRPGYDEDYLEKFYNQVSPEVIEELNTAARDTGSYWYTAWLNAGRPQLPR